MSKLSTTSKFVNNKTVINLIGSDIDMDQTVKDMQHIIHSRGLTTATVSIKPCILAYYPTNTAVAWRVELEKIMKHSSTHVIINKVGFTNNDALTDLVRSIRAFNMDCRPCVFQIDPNVTSRHNSTLDMFSQTSQIWTPLAKYDVKYNELRLYISQFDDDNFT